MPKARIKRVKRPKKKRSPLARLRARLLRSRTSKIEKAVFKLLKPLGFKPNVKVGRYVVDAIHKEKKLIVEVDGDYWHGNPAIYSDDQVISPLKITVGQKHKMDARRVNALRRLGYNVISFWEQDLRRDMGIVLRHPTIEAVSGSEILDK